MPQVDDRGRVVIPKEVREELGITPGRQVRIEMEDGEAVIRPARSPEMVLDRMDDLLGEPRSVEDGPCRDGDERSPVEEMVADPMGEAHRHRENIRKGAERAERDRGADE